MKLFLAIVGRKLKAHFVPLALACLGFAECSASAQQLFWADANLSDIKRALLIKKRSDLTAGPARSVLTNALNAFYSHVAFDPRRQKLYFTIPDDPPRLYRCRPDGGEQELLVSLEEHHSPRGLAIDPAGGKVYWPSTHNLEAGQSGRIRRANLDGSGVEDLVTGMVYPYGMALDIAGGRMFWIRQEDQSIWRANLDGSQAERFLALGTGSYAFGVAVSPKTSHLFWTDPGNSLIGRANLDGSDVRSIAALDFFSLDAGITVDPASATVFWGDTINHAIYVAGLNGENPRVILNEGVNYPTSLAVAPRRGKVRDPSDATEGLRVLRRSRSSP